MEVANQRSVDLEDRILGAIVNEIVWTVLYPAIEDSFMPIVVIGQADHELLLYPNQ